MLGLGKKKKTIIRMITNTFDWFIALYGKVDSNIERNCSGWIELKTPGAKNVLSL